MNSDPLRTKLSPCRNTWVHIQLSSGHADTFSVSFTVGHHCSVPPKRKWHRPVTDNSTHSRRAHLVLVSPFLSPPASSFVCKGFINLRPQYSRKNTQSRLVTQQQAGWELRKEGTQCHPAARFCSLYPSNPSPHFFTERSSRWWVRGGEIRFPIRSD